MLNHRLNNTRASQKFQSAFDAVGLAGDVLSTFKDYSQAVRSGVGIYYVELQRNVYGGTKDIYRWTAYTQTSDNSRRVYLSGSNAARFIKRLLMEALEQETRR